MSQRRPLEQRHLSDRARFPVIMNAREAERASNRNLTLLRSEGSRSIDVEPEQWTCAEQCPSELLAVALDPGADPDALLLRVAPNCAAAYLEPLPPHLERLARAALSPLRPKDFPAPPLPAAPRPLGALPSLTATRLPTRSQVGVQAGGPSHTELPAVPAAAASAVPASQSQHGQPASPAGTTGGIH